MVRAPMALRVWFFHEVRCIRDTPGHTQTLWPPDAFMDISIALRNLVCNQRASQSPHVRVENLFNELSVECHLAQRQFVHACDALRFVSLSLFSNFVVSGSRIILMTEWVCRWRPFWVPRGDTFQKTYLEE